MNKYHAHNIVTHSNQNALCYSTVAQDLGLAQVHRHPDMRYIYYLPDFHHGRYPSVCTISYTTNASLTQHQRKTYTWPETLP